MISLLKNYDLLYLENSIETLRAEMIKIGIQEGLTCEKTVEISQLLDAYIAIYQMINKSH